jgi:hypothetical protein
MKGVTMIYMSWASLVFEIRRPKAEIRKKAETSRSLSSFTLALSVAGLASGGGFN